MSLKEKIKHSDARAYGDFPQLMKSSGFAPLMAGETKEVIFTGTVSMSVLPHSEKSCLQDRSLSHPSLNMA